MSRTLYFRGGPMSPFWWHDNQTAFHNRFQVTLDHEVESELLAIAWEKTKRVYPLIDCVPELEDGEIVFYADDRINPPICSDVPVNPGCEACSGRVFSLTYSGRKVAMSAYHSVVDGGGINAIFSTLVYFYLALHTGVEDEVPPVQTREDREPETYYTSLASMDLGEFEQQPLVTYPKRDGMFRDVRMTPDEEGNISLARLRMPAAEFMSACKRIGASPSAMLCVLMAKAAYLLHPQRTGDLAFVLTMSIRSATGVLDSIANCSTNLLLPVAYDDIVSEDLRPGVQRIRANINAQRRLDYIKTQAAFYETYDWLLASCYGTLTYLGVFNVGENTKHIVDFEMSDDAVASVFMMGLNDDFVLSFQLGRVTRDYAEAVTRILLEFGVVSELIDPPHHIMSGRSLLSPE